MSNTTLPTECPNCKRLTHLSDLKKNCDWCETELLDKEKKNCMPDEVTTKKEHIQYLSDVGIITWEFVGWAEKTTNEAQIKGVDNKGNSFEATGIMGGGEIVKVYDIERKR